MYTHIPICIHKYAYVYAYIELLVHDLKEMIIKMTLNTLYIRYAIHIYIYVYVYSVTRICIGTHM